MEDHQQERAGGGSVNSPPLSSQITENPWTRIIKHAAGRVSAL